MKRTILFIIYFSIFFLSKAQVWDDFNDGDLINNPAWSGNVDSFTVNLQSQLQLNASGAGQAYLSTTLYLSNVNEDMEWSFWIRENFSPSDNNYAKVYLTSDRNNLLDTGVQGYYLRFGESSNNDAVRLYRQQGGVHTLLCSATGGAIAGSFDIWVKVTRSALGEWVLYCSDIGKSILKEETRCIDSTLTLFNYTGLVCYYTVTNRNRFYFDDIYGSIIYKDTTPPQITNIIPDENTKEEITIVFDEIIDSACLVITNFEIDNGIGYPSAVSFSEGSLSQITIQYANPLPVNISLSLSIHNIMDISGNIMDDTVFHFLLYQSQLFDIVISEIMAKPSPAVNLPEAEYIELRNRLNLPVNMDGWTLQIGNSLRTLGNITIAANGYLLITSTSNASLFTGYGDIATVSSMQITDAGQTIQLKDNKDNLIHFVSFSDSWHENNTKKSGGWSLEMIDINNPCEGQNNWSSSQDNRGGTPHSENSISKYNPDIISPALDRVTYEGENTIAIHFSEPMLPGRLMNKNTYQFSHSLQIDSIISIANDWRSVYVTLSDTLVPETIYTLTITDTLFDCVENAIPIQSFVSFGYVANFNAFDIVISEIMAKPSPAVNLPEAEYIELRNRLNLPVNLDGWALQIGNSLRTLGNITIAANGYLLITSASNASLFTGYGDIATVSSMQITDGGQTIQLKDNEDNLIHFVSFSDSWHENNTKKSGGWSLEMIDINNPCEGQNNWSSSQDNRGGTPCNGNSISKYNPDVINPALDRVTYEGENAIAIHFSEPMLPDKLMNKNTYQFSHSLQIDSIISIANDWRSVYVTLSDTLVPETIYTLTITDTLFDCVENTIPIQSFVSFGYATYPRENDIIINEVLFNPKEDGVDFVEIYNRSNKIIDLRFLRLSSYKNDGSMDTGKVVSPSGTQLFPRQYMVLTTQPKTIQEQYYCPYPDNFIAMNSLPTYSNTQGTVILLHNLDIIDLFTYHESMHYPLLKSTEGVSLERINFERKTQDNFNWHSAASTAGYATPGYKNSSYSDNITQTSYFEVYPELFSPDNDGYNDNVNIAYSFPQPGYRASIHIYNVAGKRLKTLVNNQLLETEGYFVWDGVIDGNIKASLGT
ncbi:MAG: lamin tail domain-containing protein, partial [Bacteroidales bacterium]|nr:lamin tail domain-containing protein [Bacteroidales bacterium]